MRICFDMDEDARPYREAKVLLNMNTLARQLNKLQAAGHEIVIISWLSKCGSESYNKTVTETKKAWLKKHLGSVKFNEINIVKYGTDKAQFAKSENDILFDDEKPNRDNWTGKAYDVNNILEVLKAI